MIFIPPNTIPYIPFNLLFLYKVIRESEFTLICTIVLQNIYVIIKKMLYKFFIFN